MEPLGMRRMGEHDIAAKDPLLMTEAEAYAYYAPDTAYVVNVEAGDYVDVRPLYWVGGTTAADKWVDWGDGTREVFTGDHPKHTYEASGNYVIRLSGNCTWFRAGRYSSEMVGHKYIVRVLRFGDNVNYFTQLFTDCTRATCFPDGKLPRWPKAAASVKAFYDVYSGCTSLAPTELPAWPSGLTSIGNVYYGCTSLALTELPAWPSGLTSIGDVYSDCTSLAPTELPAWPSGLTSIGNVYWECTSLDVTEIPDWPDSCEYIGSVFRNCQKMALTKLPEWPKSLKKICDHSSEWYGVYWRCYAIKADKIPEWPEGLTSANGVYSGCRGITGKIPKWPANATQMSWTYNGCSLLTGAWTSDPAELMPTNITSHGGCVSGASDALRALFYSDWGGTRTKEETTTT